MEQLIKEIEDRIELCEELGKSLVSDTYIYEAIGMKKVLDIVKIYYSKS